MVLGDTSISESAGCDHGIAAQTILLGAREKGLAGCLLGTIKRRQLRDELGIDAQYKILLVVALGKPKEEVVVDPLQGQDSVKYWRDANEEQRQRLVDEISAMLMRSYVTAMIAYADDTLTDEQVVYLPSRYQTGDRKSAVRSKISLDSGQTIDVRYALYRTQDRWKIYDISFENISMVLTYRASFGASIRNKGLDALITRLENRNRKGEINLPGVVSKKMEESAVR